MTGPLVTIWPDARTAMGEFFDAIADPGERVKIASGNAEALFRLA